MELGLSKSVRLNVGRTCKFKLKHTLLMPLAKTADVRSLGYNEVTLIFKRPHDTYVTD